MPTDPKSPAENPPFAFGQIVYIAEASAYHQSEVPCPVCFGKKIVRLELGDGTMQPLECEMCGIGFEGPRGIVKAYGPFSQVWSGEVSGLKRNGDEWLVSVRHDTFRPSDRKVFATHEEAETRRVQLHQEAEIQAKRNWEGQFKTKSKKAGYTVGYHKREIADCERKIAWHRQRLGEHHES